MTFPPTDGATSLHVALNPLPATLSSVLNLTVMVLPVLVTGAGRLDPHSFPSEDPSVSRTGGRRNYIIYNPKC